MGLFDSLLGGEGKKFIKRKDSDAGEAGSYSLNPHYLFIYKEIEKLYFLHVIYFFLMILHFFRMYLCSFIWKSGFMRILSFYLSFFHFFFSFKMVSLLVVFW